MTKWTYTRDAPERFLAAFNALAATKGSQTDDLHHESYFEVLGDLPVEFVEITAHELQRTPGPYLPDAGTWYRLADERACAAITVDRPALVASRDAEAEEVTRLRAARDAFLSKMEQVCGRTIPADHPLRGDPPQVPTFHCLSCEDVGWAREEHTDPPRVRHCQCWSYNPTLERRRANARLQQARRQGR